MGLFFTGILIMVVGIFIACGMEKVELSMRDKDIKEHNAFDMMGFEYCGGNPNIITDCIVYLYWKDDCLEIIYKMPFEVITKSVTNTVLYNDVISFKGMTEQQISNDISVAKIAVFGMLALGMKKQKKENKYYIKMKYLLNNEEVEIILGSCGLTRLIQNELTTANSHLKLKKGLD